MKITCTGRKVTLKDAFLERVDAKLKKLDKFFSDAGQAQVTVTVEKNRQTVELTVKDKGFMMRAEKSAERMEDAFDAAVDLLTRRIIKNRKRLDTRVCQPAVEAVAADYAEEGEEDYSIIREKSFAVKPSTAEEAVLEMNMLGHDFYLYRDADSFEIHCVYRRKDGTYGVLIPEK